MLTKPDDPRPRDETMPCRYVVEGRCRYECASRGPRCLIEGLVKLPWVLDEEEDGD